MKKILKLIGVAFLVFLAMLFVIGIFSPPKNIAVEAKVSEQQQQKMEIKDQKQAPHEKKLAKLVFGLALVISIIAIFVLEPTQPKSDKRFTTGYKNNAPHKVKPSFVIKLQKIFVAIAALSLLLVYFVL